MDSGLVAAVLLFTCVVAEELVSVVDGVVLELEEVPAPTIEVSAVNETECAVVEGEVLGFVDSAGDVPSLEHAGSTQAKVNAAPNHTLVACARSRAE